MQTDQWLNSNKKLQGQKQYWFLTDAIPDAVPGKGLFIFHMRDAS
jgi:hypothetical protein